MRWRLTAAHYLNVPGTEWEYKETDRNTGKQGRKVFPVPALLNPDDGADQNYPGEIIVCHEGKGQGRDITFLGDPTPDMEPLDEEATALSESLRAKWVHPIEGISGNGQDYGQMLFKMFEKQLLAIKADAPTQNVALPGVDPTAFAEMQKQVQQLMAQNAQLLEQLVDKPTARRA